ncbi:MAG TPA: biotin--[acetyl-CoA-carboxylase] ligase [Candidatus Binatia bacterium]|nr:biotin--[acetyl-CoA-carboxylase] ligase [Candidatus Binatia bacterium]
MTATLDTRETRWLARFERLDEVGSTNDVVAGWLRDGTPEVCVAIAEVQTSGRGRNGRTWAAPRGAALLLSGGFRPTWLAPEATWRLAAIVSLAMAEACEIGASVRAGTIRLKWPNDLVAVHPSTGAVRKLAGVLGETDGLGTSDARAVVGIGVNAGWRPEDFPPELADSMTSLAELAPGAPIDREVVVHVFLQRLERLVGELRGGAFPAEAWRARQLTNGLPVRLELPDGTVEEVEAVDVDVETGALIVSDGDAWSGGAPRSVHVGEIRHLRVGAIPVGAAGV